ncbi:hypothetical protein [Wenzhouxiangella sp. EGI_FJ10409]|uniref:hypothetical protein n=1 Tax=Wenzhouxiangella sp. EGI_FJ10409 TaxID=3243767 RepID=UPI0035D66DC7
MINAIEKSGTGIGKSGTGIEKSGTGIEKSGTGSRRGKWPLLSLAAAALFAAHATASEPEVLVSAGGDQVFVSVHGSDGILVGRGDMLDDSGYYRIALYSAVGPKGSGAAFEPMVAGSGSGSAGEKCSGSSSLMVAGSGSGSAGENCRPAPGLMVAGSGSGSSTEVAGSGSGSSTEVAGSGSGSSTEVAGSGSGSAGERCFGSSSLMVAGSGSGSAGEGCGAQTMVAGSGSGAAGEGCVGGRSDVAGSGSGSATEVAGSGSGSAGEGSGCAAAANAWGVAEVVVDSAGTHVVVHQIKESVAEEYLVAFLPVSNREVAHSLVRGSSKHGFVATP